MDLSLTATLSIVVLTFIVFGFANWRARQPSEPLKVRMINYHVVQMVCIVVILVMAAHLITIFSGRPVTGQQPGGRPF
jgi:amino acid transporter